MPKNEGLNSHQTWTTVERPGYLGKTKDTKEAEWDARYGKGNWRYAWELGNGQTLGFEMVFWQVYVAGYTAYFLQHPDEAAFLTNNFAYAYDKEEIDQEQAFDPHALYAKPGHPNQFHHVALNIALEWFLGLSFKGQLPIQVREGKPGTPPEDQPLGYPWSPGRIPAVKPELIPAHIEGWWYRGSIEDLYQSAKVLQIKSRNSASFPIPSINKWD